MLSKKEQVVEKSVQGCAACPYVDVRKDGHWEPAGEILRFLDTPEARGWDGLAIFHSGGPVELRIAERKHEITHLDALELRVGQDRYPPRACARESLDWCDVDSRSRSLHQGDMQRVRFDLPEQPLGWVELFAHGHYVPLEP